jgi:TolA-binding protein
LERFLAEYPAAGAADLAWLTLGELRLKQYAENPAAAAPPGNINGPGTNSLTRAMACFDTLTKKFPASPLVGKAQLDLGWCHWSSTNAAASQTAFQAAVEHLPFSPDLATAHFKLADAEFLQTNYAGAITNYGAIIQKFAALPEVETNLFEPALYQIVQAGLAGKDLAAATNALAKILAAYPNGFHTAGAVMMTGQELGRQGNPAEARRMLLDFVKTAPESALRLEVELAIARTYEQETNWTGAIQEYDAWLGRYTNQPARARAEYFRASALYQTGDETNALRGFTNVVAEFPTNELATQAQWWVADYYFRAGAYTRAENDFQLLSRSWPKSELAYQARMMAGRAAVGRLGWSDASNYFAALAGDTNCPEDLRIQALFAYGNTLMSQDSPNKRQDYQEAFRCFDKICTEFPTNPLTVLAWGEMAGCLLQWAQSSAQLEDALKAFQHVIDAPGANVKARSIARVGLGVVLEKQAKEKTGDEQTALRRQALEHYLDVFFYDKILRGDEQPDHFWVRKAGLEAARLASELGDWCQAAGVYERLARLLPQGRAALEEKYLKAQENCAHARK